MTNARTKLPTWRPIAKDKVEVGDSASHLHRDLDPRPVAKVDHKEGLVWIQIGTLEAGPYPLENYSYSRRSA